MVYFCTLKNKQFVFWSVVAYSVIGYFLTNHYPVFEPKLLPLTFFDLSVPLIPWWMWIYVSMYPMMYLAFYMLDKDESDLKLLNQSLFGFFLLQTLAFIIFFFFPTTYPRDQFVFPMNEMDIGTKALFQFIHFNDRPTNCLPSLHVANCFIVSFFLYEKYRARFYYFLGWTFLVSFSTMATKQHYFFDVAAGFFCALTCYLIAFKLIQFREGHKSEETNSLRN